MLFQNTRLAANLATIPSFCLRHVIAWLSIEISQDMLVDPPIEAGVST
jgi:hypothetical protein